jgi:NTP pyrophosphatase (non-canonical NTP hydrolase)
MDFKEIYEKQFEFESMIVKKSKFFNENKELADLNDKEKTSLMKELILYLIKETTELLDAIGNYKMHKTKKDDPKIKEIPSEIADCMIFVLDFALIYGLSAEDLLKAVAEKQKINFQRQENGY